jgi:hypothetical protein
MKFLRCAYIKLTKRNLIFTSQCFSSYRLHVPRTVFTYLLMVPLTKISLIQMAQPQMIGSLGTGKGAENRSCVLI